MLPRIREALAKAEKARFYKERIHRNTVEALLHKRLDLLEQCRRRSINRMSDEIRAVRLGVIGLRDEEAALAESDSALMLEAVKRRVDNSRRVFYRDRLKYKSEQDKAEFAERQERWRQLEDSESDWRLPAPPQLQRPQIRLNKRLLWPGQKSVGHYRRLYKRLVRRPESRLGEKCLQALQKKHCRAQLTEKADRAFIEDLAGQLVGWSPFVTQLEAADDAGASKKRRQPNLKLDARGFTDKLPPIHEPQSTLPQARIDHKYQAEGRQLKTLHQRHLALLCQVEETRLAIRHWELGNSSETLQLLEECRLLRTESEKSNNPETSARRPKQLRRRRRHTRSGKLPALPDDVEAEAACSNVLDGLDNQSASKVLNSERPKKSSFDLLPNEQVVDCRYIRGYEAPEMLLPTEGQSMIDFIFDS